MKDKARPRAKFYVDRKSRFVHDAVMFMILSAVFRIVGCWGLWNERFFALTQIALPIACNFLFIFCLTVLGEKAFPSTIVPVILGLVFFVIRSLGFESWLHTVLCIALYAVIALVYTATAIGVIRSKWFLLPLFGLPFIYHVAVEDIAALRDTTNPVLFSDGMQELSVLAIMLALLFTALAMKKRKMLEEAGLPKIKDPVVIVPPKPEAQPQESEKAPAAALPEAEAAESLPEALPEAEQALSGQARQP